MRKWVVVFCGIFFLILPHILSWALLERNELSGRGNNFNNQINRHIRKICFIEKFQKEIFALEFS